MDDFVQIDLPQELDPHTEQVFADICYSVRNQSQAGPQHPVEDAPQTYAIALLEEIEERKLNGSLTAGDYAYCRAAAGDILALETVYFENQFVSMSPASTPDAT